MRKPAAENKVTPKATKATKAKATPKAKLPAVWYTPIEAPVAPKTMSYIIREIKPAIVRDLHRKIIYKILIRAFEAEGWTGSDNYKGVDVAYDTALGELRSKVSG
jgi:hypothetical protein